MDDLGVEDRFPGGDPIHGVEEYRVLERLTGATLGIGALTARLVFPGGKTLAPADRAKLEAAARVCPVKQSLHPDVKVQMEFVYPD